MMNLSNADASQMLTSARKAISKVGGTFRSFTRDEADDLVQTAIVKAIESYDASKGTPGACAYIVARTVATDYLRGRTYAGGNKVAGLSSDGSTSDEDGDSVALDLPDHVPSALDLLISGERTLSVADALAELTAPQREAVRADLADERILTGAERIAKMRAVESIQESVGRKRR